MARKRAPSGNGNLYYWEDKKLWVARITVNGKRKVKYGKTQREVNTWLLETRKALADNTYVDNNMTVAEFFEIYFRDHGKTLRASTLRSYQNMYNWHIKDTIGHIKLLRLSAVKLNELYTAKLTEGLSNRTVEYINGVLRRAFNMAIKWGLLKFNPCLQTSPPKVGKKEMKTWTKEQVQTFFKHIAQDRWEAIYYVATLGLREGEILSLTWGNVDLKLGNLKVVSTVQFIQGKGLVFGEPKSARSKRMVALPYYVVAALTRHKEKQSQLKESAAWSPNPDQPVDLVFTTNKGTAISPRNLIRHFKQELEKAGLPEIRFHDLRHTTATLLLEKNEHPLVVASLLGHSSVNLVLSTYSHVTPGLVERAADKLGEIFD